MFRHHNTADERSGGASKRLSDRFGIPEQEVNELLYGRQQQNASADPLLKGELRMPTPVNDSNRWGPAYVLAALLGIAGILALIILMMLVTHHHHEMDRAEREFVPPPVMQAPEQAPQSQVQPPVVAPAPNDQQVQPNSSSSDQSGAPNAQNPETQTAPKKPVHHTPKGYSTTSNMDAEEHLAELRADGNKHAQIHTSKKDGVVTYTVR